MEHYAFGTRGVCARAIEFDYDGSALHNIRFNGGCNGNLKAISRLLEGQDPQYVIDVLRGNTCGGKSTSCADQLAQGMEKLLAGDMQPVG